MKLLCFLFHQVKPQVTAYSCEVSQVDFLIKLVGRKKKSRAEEDQIQYASLRREDETATCSALKVKMSHGLRLGCTADQRPLLGDTALV